MSRKILFILSLISLFLSVSCSQDTDININDAVGKSEDYFRKLEGIAATASSFDGNKDVKFRLMVEGNLTEAEATILFKRILDVTANFSNHSDVWDYYNGFFDIMNYDYGVIYEGTKRIGEDLKVQSK
ncbi:hypothetical protein [Paenibacillus sp. Y412MC10]|uniref:hypothetical protein n=1 Tax=Geobacillus sp. (strain Y412MC10) TaxID=481743 RepID=UPI0011A870D2|nr:hypothetical protein [Paenibacillus sp. Y412MC10]